MAQEEALRLVPKTAAEAPSQDTDDDTMNPSMRYARWNAVCICHYIKHLSAILLSIYQPFCHALNGMNTVKSKEKKHKQSNPEPNPESNPESNSVFASVFDSVFDSVLAAIACQGSLYHHPFPAKVLG